MGNECRFICDRFKLKYSPMHTYKTGYQYCSICEAWMKQDGLFCPCCCRKMRTKHARRKYKSRKPRKPRKPRSENNKERNR